MELQEFINRAINDYSIEWAEGEHDGNPGVYVKCDRLDTKAHFTYDAIKDNDWPVLKEGIVQGKDVSQITRVVGYYSRVENWNKSKIGELADRQAGEYQV